MNKTDEFEGLIKNFKLNDMDEAPQRPRQAVPQRRPAAPSYGARPAARPGPAAPARPTASRTPREGSPRQQERETFHVRIDEKQYNPPRNPLVPPRPPRGGGGSAPPPYEPDNGDDDDDEIEAEDTWFSGLGRWTKALLVLAVVLAVSAFLAMFALASAVDLFGLNKEDKLVVVELPEGDINYSDVAALLKKSGVITQPLTFQIYANLKLDEDAFIPGTYELNSNMSYDQIFARFRSGNSNQEAVKLTFYEGMTVMDIAQKLEENGVCTAEELYSFLREGDMPWEFEFLSQVPDAEARYQRFEGYLFPDTYDFVKGEDVSRVVQKFFVNFNNRINDDIRQKIQKTGMNLDQVLTLASIIQKEAGNVEDMKLISSVFQNRLASPQQTPKLQSDVTVFYVNDNIKPFMDPDEVAMGEGDPNRAKIYNFYNTYQCDGLPVGPICNPGLDAINAVLEPTDSDYFYFVADSEGKTYYAATLAEHNANVEQALTKGDAHGVDTGVAIEETGTNP